MDTSSFKAQAALSGGSAIAAAAVLTQVVRGKPVGMALKVLAGLGAAYMLYTSYQNARYAWAPARPTVTP